jgi:hypothetical protein
VRGRSRWRPFPPFFNLLGDSIETADTHHTSLPERTYIHENTGLVRPAARSGLISCEQSDDPKY